MIRAKGKLVAWKGDRGFGFIKPDDGAPDVFVHRSDFGSIAREPTVGDVILYQALRDRTGKWRAGDVQIEGVVGRAGPSGRKPKRHLPKSSRPNRSIATLFGVVGIALIGLISWNHTKILGLLPSRLVTPASWQSFKCEGKQYCQQMKSCDEAGFYINNCPNTKMDGDNDGKPCEDWCGH